MNPIIAETLASFTLDNYRPIFRRSLDLGAPLAPKAGNLVCSITGMRRSGKTYRLFQEMDALLQSGIPSSRILYFNFEDERLEPVTPAVGDAVLETFLSMNPEAVDEGFYLFLDEIQEMQDWGKWLRRVVDTYRATIYVTGSSSKMLSSEISTEFRGRSISYEQPPFGFSEYVRYHHGSLAMRSGVLAQKSRITVQAALPSYLTCGGFPGVQDLHAQQRIQVLQSYVQRVVARDVVERHNLGNPQVARVFAQNLVALNGRTVSLRKMANDFKSRGMKADRAGLSAIVGYLEDAFLIHTVKERSRALRENDNTLPKVYAVDPGLFCANAKASVRDEGQRLEQAVYLELRRRERVGRSGSISFLKTAKRGYEVDFAVGDAIENDGLELYQVADNLADAVLRERETRALWEAMVECGCAHSTLIVGEGDFETLEKDGLRIDIVPAWDWLLRG